MKVTISTTISLLLIIVIFVSNPPWFIWGGGYLFIASAVLLLFCVITARLKQVPKYFLIMSPIFLISFFYFVLFKGVSEFRFSSVIFFITYMCLFFINDDEKIYAFDLLSKIFGIVVSVSLFFWIINNFIFQLPYVFKLNYSDLLGKGGNLIFNNYIVFIQSDSDFLRFYGVFDEPGVLGTLSAFVLYGQGYNFKKSTNLFILLGGVFTFSLAFYVITILGFLIYLIKNRKLEYFFMLFLSFFGFLGLSLIESFRVIVIDRFLSLDDSANGRSNILLDQYYEEFLKSNKLLFGDDLNFFSNNLNLLEGQTYKFFVIEYGLVGVVLLLLIYISLFNMKKINLLNFAIFAIFVLSFLQRPFMFTPWQIILFSIILAKLNRRIVS